MASNIISKVISFATLSFLARALKPDQLGLYNAIQNSGNSINGISSVGTPMVIQRIGARVEKLGSEKVSEIFSNAFSLYLLINFIVGLVLAIFPHMFFELLMDSKGEVRYITYISLIVVLNAVAQAPLYLLLGLEEFRGYALRNLGSVLFILVISILLIGLMEDNLQAALIAMIIAFFFNAMLTGWIFLRTLRKYSLRFNFSLKPAVLKGIFSEGLVYFIGNVFLPALSNLVIISQFYKHLSSTEYGFLRIGTSIEVFLTIIPAALQPVTISLLAKESKLSNYMKSIQIRLLPVLSAFVLILVAFNMQLVLTLFFGPNYLAASSIVYWMILLQVLFLYQGLINNFLVGAGNLNFVGYVAIIGILLMISVTLLLIPILGINGYFIGQYIATGVGLSILSFKEFYKKKILNKVDWISFLIVGILMIISFVGMRLTHEYLRIPLSILTVIIGLFLFWKYALTSAERLKLLQETRDRGIGMIKKKYVE